MSKGFIFTQMNISTTTTEREHVYKTWAATYDQDVGEVAKSGKKQPAVHLSTLMEDNTDAKIIDIGAGTGIIGEELRRLGFHNVDALDASAEMLEKAAEKKLYQRRICVSMGANRLDIADDTYDALICVGSFGGGHLTHHCLPEMIRITKPGGYVVISTTELFIRDAPDLRGLEPEMKRLEDTDNWKWLSRTLHPDYVPGVDGVTFTFQVL